MNWSDERYVRLYTRETEEELLCSWQANALATAIRRKVDRSGVLEAKNGATSVAVLVRMPLEVVELALDELLRFGGRLARHPLGFVIPSFVESEEAAASNGARSRKWREERRRKRGDQRDSEQHTGNGSSPHRDEPSPQHNDSLRNETLLVRHGTVRHGTVSSSAPELELVAPAPAAKPRGRTKAARTAATQRAVRVTLPADWMPTLEQLQHARSLGLDAEHEVAKFRSWADYSDTRIKPEKWGARFDSWLHRAKELAERDVDNRGGQRRPARAAGRSEPHSAEAYAADAERDVLQ